MKAFETEITEKPPRRSSWRRPHQDNMPVAMLLNLASIKDSYSSYQQEYAGLYA